MDLLQSISIPSAPKGTSLKLIFGETVVLDSLHHEEAYRDRIVFSTPLPLPDLMFVSKEVEVCLPPSSIDQENNTSSSSVIKEWDRKILIEGIMLESVNEKKELCG